MAWVLGYGMDLDSQRVVAEAAGRRERAREGEAMGDLRDFTVIFDLDGTLVDTAPDLVRALNAVVEADGFPGVPAQDVREMVGRGARALLRRAYARNGAAMPEPTLTEKVTAFIDAYAADIAALSRPFPGAPACLDTLEAAGARLVIATNKPQRLTDLLLDALGLQDRFVRAVGADAAPKRKPDAAHLLAAVGPEGSIDRSVMVGDSGVDVAAARAAGAPVIVMTHGYSETPPGQLGADRLVSSFAVLHEAVAELASTPKD